MCWTIIPDIVISKLPNFSDATFPNARGVAYCNNKIPIRVHYPSIKREMNFNPPKVAIEFKNAELLIKQ